MDKNKLLKRIAVFTGVSLTAMHVFNRISTYIATFFEFLFGMAVLAFAESGVEYAVLEITSMIGNTEKFLIKRKGQERLFFLYTILMFSHLLMNGIRS